MAREAHVVQQRHHLRIKYFDDAAEQLYFALAVLVQPRYQVMPRSLNQFLSQRQVPELN